MKIRSFFEVGPWFYDNNTQSGLDAFHHGLNFSLKRNENLGYLCVERYAKHDHPTWDPFQLVKCYHLNKVKILQINWKLQKSSKYNWMIYHITKSKGWRKMALFHKYEKFQNLENMYSVWGLNSLPIFGIGLELVFKHKCELFFP